MMENETPKVDGESETYANTWAGRLSTKLREAELIAAEGGAYNFAQRLSILANALAETQDIVISARMCNASKVL